MDLSLSERLIGGRGTVTEVHALIAQTGTAGGRHFADVLAALIHELSEPLTAIGNYSAAAQAHLAAEPDRAKLEVALREITCQSNRLADVIHLMRDLTEAMREAG